MSKRILSLLLFIAVPMAQADEQMRAVQEELRRRNFYFGDIDGRPTNEVGEAVKRYQRRKGFTATGHTDQVTLRSLGLLARDPNEPPPRELPLPDEPVLKSDVQVNPVAEAKALTQETGVSLAALGPIAELTGNGKSAKKTASAGKSKTSAKYTADRSSGREQLRTAPQTRGIGLRASPGGLRPQRLEEAELAPLVRGYLRAASGKHLGDELHYFADRVDYLGHGQLDRRIVERTLRSYYQRWPSRNYKLAGPVEYRRDPRRGVVVVSCVVDFSLKRGSTKAKGRVLQRITFDAATADPRIVAIQERRLPRR